MANEVKVTEKTAREIDEALTDGQGIPAGEVWVAPKLLRNFLVACSEPEFINKLRGYTLPKKFYHITIWEPKGFHTLEETIQKRGKISTNTTSVGVPNAKSPTIEITS